MPTRAQAAVAVAANQDLAFALSVAFAVVNLLLSTQFLGTGTRVGACECLAALWCDAIRCHMGRTHCLREPWSAAKLVPPFHTPGNGRRSFFLSFN
jgi:hypothetical protein